MKLKLLAAAGVVALLGAPSLAYADDDSGWYLRGNAGYGTHTDMDFTDALVGDVESEGNAAFSLGVGYDFGNNWRLELDGASLWTDLGQISQVPNTFAKLQTHTAMLNAIYDFSDFGRWEPYVGAGLGVARSNLKAQAHDLAIGNVYVDNPVCVAGATCAVSDVDKSLAWQLLAGLGYQITPKLTWDTHYRYLSAGDGDFQGQASATANGSAFSVANVGLEDIGAHMLMTGFRYNFGGKAAPMMSCWDGSQVKSLADCPDRPPAMQVCWDGSEILATDSCPPRPVENQTCWDGSVIPVTDTCPAQPQVTCWDGSIVSDAAFCPPETRSGETVASLCGQGFRQEIIYYEFDRGQSAETRNTINRILDIGEFCRVDNIRVVGHTDTSGSAAYNLGLSQRRAKDARDELVRQGIDGAIITSEGKGETEPFVPTGDGVKEQLNRRTEVLIQLSEVGVIN